MSQFKTKSGAARALKRVLDEDIFTVKEIAEVADCSQRHIYNVIDPDSTTDLSAKKSERISRYFSDHDEYRVAYAMVTAGRRIVRTLEGRVTGTVKDDVMDIVKAATAIDDAVDRDMDVQEAKRLVNDIRHELTDLEAELAALEARS